MHVWIFHLLFSLTITLLLLLFIATFAFFPSYQKDKITAHVLLSWRHLYESCVASLEESKLSLNVLEMMGNTIRDVQIAKYLLSRCKRGYFGNSWRTMKTDAIYNINLHDMG